MRAAALLSDQMRKAGRSRMKDEGLWKRGMARRAGSEVAVCGPRDARASCRPEHLRALGHVASGQISANSSRARVHGDLLTPSRQRSLNPSPTFSTGMASHHDDHGPSDLANTS
jgi:hypothetical protein